MIVSCPLSGNTNVVLLEKVRTRDLIKLYKRTLGLDVSAEFGKLHGIGFYHCPDSDLIFFHPVAPGSAGFYDRLQLFDWYYMDDKNEYAFAEQFIKPDDAVLEIGCGKGAFAHKISAKKYVGLDLNKQAAEAARSSGVIALTERIQDFASENLEGYDVVCAFQVLEHVVELRSFIKACVDCLKPGALLLYSVPSQDSFSKYVPNFFLDMPPHHLSRWSDRALQNITKYFPLRLQEIWHEPLQPAHKALYSMTVFRNALNDLFGISPRSTVDLRLRTKMVTVFSGILGRLFARGLCRNELLPRGISATAVYRKTSKVSGGSE